MIVKSIGWASAAAPVPLESTNRRATCGIGEHIEESAPTTPAREISFARIVEKTRAAVYMYARRFTPSAEDAHDIVQDVYLVAWRAALRGQAPFAGELDGDLDDVAMHRWLFSVTYRRAASLLRHHWVIRWQSLDAVSETGIPVSAIQTHEALSFDALVIERQILRGALAQLQPEDVTCLLMSVVQGYTAAEIAHTLGITAEAARKRLSRAMRRLRVAYLAQEGANVSGNPRGAPHERPLAGREE